MRHAGMAGHGGMSAAISAARGGWGMCESGTGLPAARRDMAPTTPCSGHGSCTQTSVSPRLRSRAWVGVLHAALVAAEHAARWGPPSPASLTPRTVTCALHPCTLHADGDPSFPDSSTLRAPTHDGSAHARQPQAMHRTSAGPALPRNTGRSLLPQQVRAARECGTRSPPRALLSTTAGEVPGIGCMLVTLWPPAHAELARHFYPIKNT